VEAVHVVGGGSNNALLCQLTANATRRTVFAGPAEATAVGNVLVQAIALGEIASIAQGREIVARSFPSTAYEPRQEWSEARQRFEQLFKDEPCNR
jgi:sugar (pentulose or hexulose) kinase